MRLLAMRLLRFDVMILAYSLILCRERNAQPALVLQVAAYTPHLSRRTVIVQSVGEIALPLLAGTPSISNAAQAVTPGEAIRSGASNLPGYGPSDVFYPDSCLGTYKMYRNVVVNERTTLNLAYPVRFIQSLKNNAVVADRGFNQANLEAAIRKAQPVSTKWTETNPNDLRIEFSDGSTKEIKVTKRATELGGGRISSSEFQRVTTMSGINGIPEISARRVLTKYTILDDGSIDGLEIVYNMGGGGDPMSFSPVNARGKTPTILSKSMLRAVKQT